MNKLYKNDNAEHNAYISTKKKNYYFAITSYISLVSEKYRGKLFR